MTRATIFKILGLIGGVAIIAVLTCLLVFHLFLKPHAHEPHSSDSFLDQLNLEPQLYEEVVVIDQRFEEERQSLLDEFSEKTGNLASLLLEEDRFTEQVMQSIHEIHEIHGALQALSIRRYFAILAVLPPEKQAILRQLAAGALSEPR